MRITSDSLRSNANHRGCKYSAERLPHTILNSDLISSDHFRSEWLNGEKMRVTGI